MKSRSVSKPTWSTSLFGRMLCSLNFAGVTEQTKYATLRLDAFIDVFVPAEHKVHVVFEQQGHGLLSSRHRAHRALYSGKHWMVKEHTFNFIETEPFQLAIDPRELLRVHTSCCRAAKNSTSPPRLLSKHAGHPCCKACSSVRRPGRRDCREMRRTSHRHRATVCKAAQTSP